MLRIGYRHQRTLASTAELRGVGFVTGARSRLRFRPADPDTGIVFVRTDLPGKPAISARADCVTGTKRRTTLGGADSGVTLVEHVIAALSGLRIDNCLVEIDAVEPPGLDGSSAGFVQVLCSAGIELQAARREVWSVRETVTLNDGDATIAIHPLDPKDGPLLKASYILDYGPHADIPRQSYTTTISTESFIRDIAGCRTFVLEREAVELRNQGIGRHLTANQLLVFGPRGPIDNTLRFADEPARHKVLDLIGDLALTGFDLVGHVVACRSGHSLNVAMAKKLHTMVPSLPPSRLAGVRRRAAA